MILTFHTEDVRAELAHAHRSIEHVDARGAKSALVPSLHLQLKEDEVCLVSSGRPASGTSARAIDFDPKSATTAEAAEVRDLSETIAEDAFALALAGKAPQVSIVVTTSYINVLGGQPKRPPQEARIPSQVSFGRSRPATVKSNPRGRERP